MTAKGNDYHHNTVIWDAGSTAYAGVFQDDARNQPNLFFNNTLPDYNQYHMSNTAAAQFVYDNNSSGLNSWKTFAQFQEQGAEVHGSIDTNTNVGFPAVQITSPTDQSPFDNSVIVSAKASDTSGISRVEFYVDWALQATVTNPPYNVNVNPGAGGPHTVAAMAYSNAGVRACYAVTLNAPDRN